MEGSEENNKINYVINKQNHAELCPVCYGKGIVPEGFYSSTGMTWVSNGTMSEQCKSCQGKGYIVI